MARNRRTSPALQHLARLLPPVFRVTRLASTARRDAAPVPEAAGVRSQGARRAGGRQRGLRGGYNKALLDYLQGALHERYAGVAVEIEVGLAHGLSATAARDMP